MYWGSQITCMASDAIIDLIGITGWVGAMTLMWWCAEMVNDIENCDAMSFVRHRSMECLPLNRHWLQFSWYSRTPCSFKCSRDVKGCHSHLTSGIQLLSPSLNQGAEWLWWITNWASPTRLLLSRCCWIALLMSPSITVLIIETDWTIFRLVVYALFPVYNTYLGNSPHCRVDASVVTVLE